MPLLPQIRIDYDAGNNYFWLSTDGTTNPTAELNSYTPKGAKYDINYTLINNVPKVAGYDVDLVEDEIVCTFYNDVVTRDNLHLLNQIAARARWYSETNLGYRITLDLTLDSTNEIWGKSQIYNIEIQHSEEIFQNGIANGDIKVYLRILREPYFEELSPIALPVLNGTDLSVNVGNTGNWYAKIPATAIEGDTPTPAIISLTNLTPTHNITDLYIGVERIEAGLNDNSKSGLMIEGESFSGGTQVNTSVSTDSNGAYKTFNFPTSEAQITKYVIPAASIPALGKWYKVFFRFTGTPGASPNYIRYKFQKVGAINASQVYFSSELYLYDMSQQLQDFGVVQLPPYNIYPSGIPGVYEDIEFAIYGYTAGGTSGFQLDYVFFMPVTEFRYYKVFSDMYDSSHAIKDENKGNKAYLFNISNSRIVPSIAVYGDPILLMPNYTHYFYFLWKSGSLSYINDQVQVTVEQRKRRNTL